MTYQLAGVMGWPVGHSRSPIIHSHWMSELGLHGAYVLLPVVPEKLEQALRALPLLGFCGCNLTIPHKVAALSIVDRIDPLAQRIGAINCIVVEGDGSLSGSNTDAFGYIQSLLDAQPAWQADAGPALVMGAGGAARAVIAGLLDSGTKNIRLTNRSFDNTHALVAAFGPCVEAVECNERHTAVSGASLVVNTTSLGMQGQPALDLDLTDLDPLALVSDVIYVPQETPLLAAARLRGNPTVNGLGMLLNQARPAFKAWFGAMPKISDALLAKMHASF